MIGAIAAGNTVVLKPSEQSSNCAAVMQKIMQEALDPDAYTVVQGAIPETSALLDQKWDKNLLHWFCPHGKNRLSGSSQKPHASGARIGRPEPSFCHEEGGCALGGPAAAVVKDHECRASLYLTESHSR